MPTLPLAEQDRLATTQIEEVPIGHPDHPLTGQDAVQDRTRTKTGEIAEPET